MLNTSNGYSCGNLSRSLPSHPDSLAVHLTCSQIVPESVLQAAVIEYLSFKSSKVQCQLSNGVFNLVLDKFHNTYIMVQNTELGRRNVGRISVVVSRKLDNHVDDFGDGIARLDAPATSPSPQVSSICYYKEVTPSI